MNPYILTAYCGHDAAAVLLKDGKIACAVKEERLDRIKHSDASGDNISEGSDDSIHFPWKAVRYCLEAEQIKEQDIGVFSTNFYGNIDFDAERKAPFPSHHLSHAASVFYTNQVQDCTVLVMDYAGDTHWLLDRHFLGYERESAWFCDREGIWPIWQHLGADEITNFGIGSIYNQVAAYLFKSMDAEGKAMALSALGRPNKELGEPFFIHKNGKVFLRPSKLFRESDHRPEFLADNMPNYVCELNWDALPPSPGDLGKFTQFHCDLAYKVQKELEEAILYMAKNLFKITSSQNLGLVGGVALNCLANMEVLKHSGFKRVLVPPFPDDSGQAVGAAFYLYNQEQSKIGSQATINYGFTGRKYSDEEIEEACKANANLIEFEKIDKVAEIAAQAIADGKIIGWFQYRSEFGPRALGARSILTDPRNKKAIERLNKTIKRRNWFQPVAPSILQEFAEAFFEVKDSYYMNLACPVKDDVKRKVPGIVHLNETSRMQVVSAESNPVYYQLIQSFYQLTQTPVVANTSFNGKGEPIVESPAHAINAFLGIGLDLLFLGPYLVKKKSQPSLIS